MSEWGSNQESIDHFKARQNEHIDRDLFGLGFDDFQERINDLKERYALDDEEIVVIVKEYFPSGSVDLKNKESYNFGVLNDVLLRVQNVALAKQNGLINTTNESVVRALANSNMFNNWFEDTHELRELLSNNNPTQLQAKLDQKNGRNVEIVSICQDL